MIFGLVLDEAVPCTGDADSMCCKTSRYFVFFLNKVNTTADFYDVHVFCYSLLMILCFLITLLKFLANLCNKTEKQKGFR